MNGTIDWKAVANQFAKLDKTATVTIKTGNEDGSIEIKLGQILVTDPKGFGKFPDIASGENVEVVVNGAKITGPTMVQSTDVIEVKVIDREAAVNYEVEFSPDKMKAFLLIRRIPGYKYVVQDSRPLTQMKVTAACFDEVEPEKASPDEALIALYQSGVVFGTKIEKIREAVILPGREVKMEVACGKEPYGVVDAVIIYNFAEQPRTNEVQNPYGEGKIHSVTAGEIVARKTPPVPGNPGVDVTGHPVLPRRPKDTPILVGDGVKLINGGQMAVATRAGSPVLEGYSHKYLTVRPVHIVEGDVDMSVGNIKFKGDIYVKGDVLDGFTLEAEGSIKVMGNVLHATLRATKDIVIAKNAITTKLFAGGSAAAYRRIYQLLAQLVTNIEGLLTAMQVLKQQKAFAEIGGEEDRDGRLVQVLIDHKYQDLPKLVNDLEGVRREMKGEAIYEIEQTAQLLNAKFSNLGPLRIKSEMEIQMLIMELKKAMAVVEHLILEKANIVVDYVQNSFAQASGDIIVTGQGAVTSYLEAGGSIQINRGIVRGGKLIAKGKQLDLTQVGRAKRSIAGPPDFVSPKGPFSRSQKTVG